MTSKVFMCYDLSMKDVSNARKISIIGPCGSGKSFLAQKLGEILNLPVHHLDSYYHKPNGERETSEFITNKVKEIIRTEKWIIDGTYNKTLADRFLHSDIVIYLDFEQDFCVKSVKERHTKTERLGVPEYFAPTDESLNYMISFHIAEKHPKIKTEFIIPLVEKYKDKVLTFITRKQVNDFINKNIACQWFW